MSHPYHHAVSSSRIFGGDVLDYLDIHNWFDATKISVADQRHRAFRHFDEAIGDLTTILGKTHIINRDGVRVELGEIGLQHLREDFGGYVPHLADWVEAVGERPWMRPNRGEKGAAALVVLLRRYGGSTADYAALLAWFHDGTTDDPRTYFRRGHAMACFWAEEVFGATIPLTCGKALPTRLAAEVIVASMFVGRIIPSPQDWVRSISRPDWQGQPRLLAA